MATSRPRTFSGPWSAHARRLRPGLRWRRCGADRRCGRRQPGRGAPGPRSRATTPNWDDPARLPVRRQRRRRTATPWASRSCGWSGPPISPSRPASGLWTGCTWTWNFPGPWRRLPDMPGLWELCERALSLADAEDRPGPVEWSARLEELLDVLGAGHLAVRARAAQGDPGLCGQPAAGAPVATVPDVAVRPVLRQRTASTWQLMTPRVAFAGAGEVLGGRASAAGATRRELFPPHCVSVGGSAPLGPHCWCARPDGGAAVCGARPGYSCSTWLPPVWSCSSWPWW